MKRSLLSLVAITLLSAFVPVFGQGPPKVLYIIKEDIKPGMMAAHNEHSASFARIFRTLVTPNYRIALSPIAGSENEVIYFTGAESFKQLEEKLNDTDKKLGGISGSLKADLDRLNKEAPVLHAGMRDMFAVFRPELSYNPSVDIRTMRYFSITTLRVRPGQEVKFVEYVEKLIAAAGKAKADNYHIAAFQVVSGAPAGTYFVLRPMKSLGEMDNPVGMRVRNAMSDDTRKDVDKAISDSIMSSETSTYLFAPGMSYVEQEFAAGDPTFWNPKPPMRATPKLKRRMVRPVAPPPPTD